MSGELVARVFVPGRSRTKGSLKPLHQRGQAGRPCKVGLTESGKYSTPWKKTVMRALAQSLGGVGGYFPYGGAVEVHAFFRFEKLCKPDEEMPWPTREQGEFAHGDVDKLWRNVLDALTQAHVLADDSLVVGGMPYKRWCQEGEEAGVLIVVTAAPDPSAVLELERKVLAL